MSSCKCRRMLEGCCASTSMAVWDEEPNECMGGALHTHKLSSAGFIFGGCPTPAVFYHRYQDAMVVRGDGFAYLFSCADAVVIY